MQRYGCFPIHGAEGTSWYVYDTAVCGEIVSVHDYEHAARLAVFRLNADERRWEKAQLAATNGRT